MPSIAATSLGYSGILTLCLYITTIDPNYVLNLFPIIAILHLKSSKSPFA